MFSKSDKKNNFLEQTKAARQERAQEKYREQAVILIQAYVRGFLARTRLKREVRKEFDKVFGKWKDNDSQQFLLPAMEVFKLTRKFLVILNEKADQQRFEKLCHHLALSMTSDNMKYCYISVAMSKDYTLLWIKQLKDILWRTCLYLRELRPECPNDSKSLAVYLHTLLTFTSISTWKILKSKSGEPLQKSMTQLCSNVMGYMNSKGFYPTIQTILNKGLARSKPCLKHASLSAITTLAIRPAIAAQFSDNIMSLFLLHILSVPAVIFHLSSSAAECLAVLMTYNIFKRSLDLLTSEQNTRIIFNSLEGNYALCLLANIIHLAALMNENLTSLILDFTNVVTRLLESCQKYVVQKKSNLTHWHPVLGWFSQTVDHRLHEAMPFVSLQLQLLWNNSMITILFDSLLTEPCSPLPSTGMTNTSPSRGSNLIRKAMEKASSRTGSIKYKKLGSSETIQVAMICALYEMALTTLTQMKLDILAGLSYQDILLPRLWKFICSVGPNNGLKAFLDHLAINPKVTCPEYQILVLFCDCTTHLVTILDDIEMYEQQKPFQLEEILAMSNFLNQFIFKIIWNSLIDIKDISNNMLFNSTHTLLMLLYQRDCRRSYAPTDHWLIKEVKSSAFLSELEKGKKAAQLLLQEVPHIIPHHERVVLFRKHVANEKTVLGLTESACASPQSTLITVHRSRIVEDGYRQLALLPPQALKGVIRVKFINEQGLDEAGIDQDGVFKEFLEETIKHVFDPSLNLFSVTTEERLYPSPSSHIHENHLALFEFVGRMLAKAVYEGIVVDVPFASFFLSQVLGHQQSALYSCIDELPSLDSDLYKSLTYIKHYEGDVRDLDLTFSCNEDYMGQLVTHELIPGGKAMPVTNENKISYVHLMAHFRMYIQIKDQTLAFIRGFRSIVNPEWLNIFSTPEVQRLISGDNAEIDLEDLRRHTQYYGGFHNNHRVVNWLWDILSKEFTPHERSLFLKFVTSCSKPPLLGFAHLEPPFSIRCVEVNDDQDTGDTLGSVLRGFFTINKKDPVNRLPTSSTCFNLLKLPNYQKKSTLRDKLRYAVSSNTGFELS